MEDTGGLPKYKLVVKQLLFESLNAKKPNFVNPDKIKHPQIHNSKIILECPLGVLQYFPFNSTHAPAMNSKVLNCSLCSFYQLLAIFNIYRFCKALIF